MQLVRADKVLGLLRDAAVFVCREQLGADRRAEHVIKRVCQSGLSVCLIAVGDKAYKSANERLGNTAVDAVVGHVVAVVGCPAENRLGKVTRTDHKTVAAVGHVHEHLRALSCLAVFIYDVMIARIMSDILEVQSNRFADRNLTEIHAQLLAKYGRVILGSASRAESGHGNADQLVRRHTKRAEGIDRHQKR